MERGFWIQKTKNIKKHNIVKQHTIQTKNVFFRKRLPEGQRGHDAQRLESPQKTQTIKTNTKNTNSTKQFETTIKKEIEPFTDVNIIFVSTLNKQRIHKAIETAVKVFKGRSEKIKTRK